MFDKIAVRLLQPVNTSVISILGFFNVLLGVWLVLPFDSMGPFLDSVYVSELMLGVSTLIIGLIILGGSLLEKLGALSIGTLLGFIFWFTVTAVTLWDAWQAPLWIFSLMIALYCGFVNVNIRVNHNLLNKTK